MSEFVYIYYKNEQRNSQGLIVDYFKGSKIKYFAKNQTLQRLFPIQMYEPQKLKVRDEAICKFPLELFSVFIFISDSR